ncbi:MAG: cytochrome c [Sphingomonadales bacterium]|nr:cytochrome c [Sphingomonadales bacterium]MDE2567439.1 cytochrome c [Sphingomonadales bacterium]
MKALILVPLALGLAACSITPTKDRKADQQAASAAAPAAGPIPTYQMRPPVDAQANRLAPAADGKTLFEQRCGTCHLPWGMGTNLLTKQQVALGRPPAMGLLSNRTDLTADYVKTVVRQGKNAMPPLTKVDVTDAELDRIAAYLAKAQPAPDASASESGAAQ